MGLVTGAENGTLYTIEGNVSNQVMRCERQLDSVQIIGYGCPLYADLENQIVPELPVMTVTPGMTNLATSISWTASAHAQKYLLVIWDADGNEVVREETTGVRFQKLLPDGDYTAQLTAENSGTTVTTEKQAFTVTENHNPLPFSAVVNAGTDEEPSTVSWTESVGALSYRVCFVNADTGQTAETLETDNTVRTCEKQLEPGNYTVQVTACSGSYETASPVLSFTVKYRRPVTAPVLEVNGGTYNTSTTITWDDGERAVGYRIRIIREEFCYEFSHLVCPPVGVDSSLNLVYQNDITIVEEDMGMQHSWSGVLTEGFYWVYVTAYNAAGDTAEAYHSLNVRVPLEGDLDDDGKLTQQDAVLLEQYLLGDLAFSRYGMTLRADMDGDGRVNGFDLALLRQKIV